MSMADQLINIRTDRFTKKEISVLEEYLKECNYDWIVEILYVGEGTDENLDVTFTLKQDDLGEFLWLVYGCGYEFAYHR
jgi:hypothetical protein